MFPQPLASFQPLIVPSQPQPDLIDSSSVFPPPCSFSSILTEPTYCIDLSSLHFSNPTSALPHKDPIIASIPSAESGTRLLPITVGGRTIGVMVIPGKEGIWLGEGVTVDTIEKKDNGVFEFQSIILGTEVWRDDRVAIMEGKSDGDQCIVIVSTHRIDSPIPTGYAMFHNVSEYVRALFISDREREVMSTKDVEQIAKRALGGTGAQIFRRFRRA